MKTTYTCYFLVGNYAPDKGFYSWHAADHYRKTRGDRTWGTRAEDVSYATKIGYTDRVPYEIVRVVSDLTVDVRELDTTRLTDPVFAVGGFSGHCVNNADIKYEYHRNESNPVVRIRQHRDGFFYTPNGDKFRLAREPYKYFDYNF